MPTAFRIAPRPGQLLVRAALPAYAGRSDVLVLALPRGGVPVAYEVARALEAPLDVFVVRKLGLPGHRGAGHGGHRLRRSLRAQRRRGASPEIPSRVIEAVAARELRELERRERAYRGDRPPPEVRGRTVILVDDGLATGSTMRAAVAALRRLGPARIIVAVPTAAPSTCEEFRHEADECVCDITPDPFYAVGLWYEDFSQTTDDEVRDLLERSANEMPSAVSDR